MSYPSAYSGQITKIQYVDEARYQFRAGTIQNKWYYIYLLMNNAKSVEEKALADGNKVMAGVAITWKILLESIATDSWRDVPFFEACRMSEGLLLPKYDKQEDIYPAMIDSLGVASELLASGTGSAVTSGVSFLNDNAGNWLKFCNSMRFALVVSSLKFSRQAILHIAFTTTIARMPMAMVANFILNRQKMLLIIRFILITVRIMNRIRIKWLNWLLASILQPIFWSWTSHSIVIFRL